MPCLISGLKTWEWRGKIVGFQELSTKTVYSQSREILKVGAVHETHQCATTLNLADRVAINTGKITTIFSFSISRLTLWWQAIFKDVAVKQDKSTIISCPLHSITKTTICNQLWVDLRKAWSWKISHPLLTREWLANAAVYLVLLKNRASVGVWPRPKLCSRRCHLNNNRERLNRQFAYQPGSVAKTPNYAAPTTPMVTCCLKLQLDLTRSCSIKRPWLCQIMSKKLTMTSCTKIIRIGRTTTIST